MEKKSNGFGRFAPMGALALGLALVVAATALVSCGGDEDDGGGGGGGGGDVSSLTVTTQPTKTGYFVGDTLDTTGMVVRAQFASDPDDEDYQDYTLEWENGTAIANGDTLSTATTSSNLNLGDLIYVTAPGLTEWFDKGSFRINVYDDVTKASITGTTGQEWRYNYSSSISSGYTRTASFSGDTLTFTEEKYVGVNVTPSATFTLTLTWGEAATASDIYYTNKGFAVTGTYSVTNSDNYSNLRSDVKAMFGSTAASDNTALPTGLKLVIARLDYSKYLYLTDGTNSIQLGEGGPSTPAE